MSTAVLRRFIILMIVLIVLSVGYQLLRERVDPPPGDFEVKAGNIHLEIGEFDEALEDYDAALAVQPDHRGALMGRAIAFLAMGKMAEAEAEFDYMIDYLERTLEPDDPTGRGALAAAYANRGIMYDRLGEYEQALEDYKQALRIDHEVVEGPGVVDKILHIADPSNVLMRAKYLQEQLALPEEERVMRIPEEDAKQRMHRP